MLFALLEHFPTTSANRIHDNASIFAEMVRMLGQDSNLLNHQRLAKDISTVANSWCISSNGCPVLQLRLLCWVSKLIQVDPRTCSFSLFDISISQLPGGSSLRGGGPIHSCIGPPARCVWIEGCCLQLELPTGEGLETSINKQFWKLRISEPPKFQDISFIFFRGFPWHFHWHWWNFCVRCAPHPSYVPPGTARGKRPRMVHSWGWIFFFWFWKQGFGGLFMDFSDLMYYLKNATVNVFLMDWLWTLM